MLGDHIAMISGGVLRCVGSPIYPLNRLGTGYHLTFHRQPQSAISISTMSASLAAALRPNFTDLASFVQNFIVEATLQKRTQNEMELILPRAFVETESFERLLNELTANLSRLGLYSFSLRDTSLDEVFKICEEPGNLVGGNRFSGLGADINESSASNGDGMLEHQPYVNGTLKADKGSEDHRDDGEEMQCFIKML